MDERGGGRLTGLGIVLLLVLAVVLAATNPNLEKHKAQIHRHARAEAAKEGLWATVRARLAEAADALDVMPLQYRNYVVCSATLHQGKVLSIGLLGTVLIVG